MKKEYVSQKISKMDVQTCQKPSKLTNFDPLYLNSQIHDKPVYFIKFDLLQEISTHTIDDHRLY